MSPALPALKGREIIRALESAGFSIVRSKGSHRMLQSSGNPVRLVTVPDHGAKELKRGTLRAIIRQAGLSVDEFLELL